MSQQINTGKVVVESGNVNAALTGSLALIPNEDFTTHNFTANGTITVPADTEWIITNIHVFSGATSQTQVKVKGEYWGSYQGNLMSYTEAGLNVKLVAGETIQFIAPDGNDISFITYYSHGV